MKKLAKFALFISLFTIISCTPNEKSGGNEDSQETKCYNELQMKSSYEKGFYDGLRILTELKEENPNRDINALILQTSLYAQEEGTKLIESLGK